MSDPAPTDTVAPEAVPPEDLHPSAAEPLGEVTAADLRVLVITVSTRAAAALSSAAAPTAPEYLDRSGPLLVRLVAELGASVDGPRVVADGGPVETALREAIQAGYDVVLTTGGTGFTPDDRTPEMTARVLDLQIPGIAEAVRAVGVAAGVATAIFSRGVAGIAGTTFVANLPGSGGAVRDGWSVLGPLLTEIVRHARGRSR